MPKLPNSQLFFVNAKSNSTWSVCLVKIGCYLLGNTFFLLHFWWEKHFMKNCGSCLISNWVRGPNSEDRIKIKSSLDSSIWHFFGMAASCQSFPEDFKKFLALSGKLGRKYAYCESYTITPKRGNQVGSVKKNKKKTKIPIKPFICHPMQ